MNKFTTESIKSTSLIYNQPGDLHKVAIPLKLTCRSVNSMAADSNSASALTHATRPKPWKKALLLIGSAALGGMAVVLWGRRELGRLREEETTCQPDLPQSDEEGF